MDKSNCVLCQSPSYTTEPYPSQSHNGLINFCSNCGLGFADPLICEEIYSNGEYWIKPKRKIYPVPYGLSKARWKLLNKPSNINILDIGAGHGYMSLFGNNNYHAIEPDPQMQEYIKQLRNDKTVIIPSINEVKDAYDLVIVSAVLEHVLDPVEFIESINSLIKDGGLLYIDIPNQDQLFKPDVYPHNYFFTEHSLLLLLKNFEILHHDIYGRNMNKSPLGKQTPLYLRLLRKPASIASLFLSAKLMSQFFSWYFGFNKTDKNGTWLRVTCRKGKSEVEK